MSRHGWRQHAYNCRKYQVFSEFVRTPPRQVANRGFGKLSSLWAVSGSALSRIASLCLRDDHKYVTRPWLDQLTWEGVAWWYQDDGTMAQNGQAIFCTHGFSETEVTTIVDWFQEKGIDAYISRQESRHTPGKMYPIVYLTTRASVKLVDLIRPYVYPEMVYKLDYGTVVTEAVCNWCGKTFNPSETGSLKRRQSRRTSCCPTRQCRQARRRASSMKYSDRPGGLEARKAKRLAKYWADPETARAVGRETAAKHRRENPASSKLAKKKHGMKKRAARAARPWVCQRCLLTEPQGAKSTQQRYCDPCRETVTRAIKAKSAMKHSRSPRPTSSESAGPDATASST